MDPRSTSPGERFAAFVTSREFNPIFKRLNRPPRIRYLLALAFAATGVGIPAAIGLVISAQLSSRKRRRERRELAEWARTARLIWAYPVIVNPALNDDPGAIAPGMLVGSFHPRLDGDREALAAISEALSGAYFDRGQDPELAKLMADDAYTPDRRRRVPARLTGGREAYAFDVLLIGAFLPPALLAPQLIPCLADPGPEGRIAVIPHWLAGEPPGR